MTAGQIDLGPAARQVAALAGGVRDEQLADPTPCAGHAVGDLLDHLVGLALAFRRGAEKAPLGDAAEGRTFGSAAALSPDWRALLPRRLEALVAAWRHPAAWEGRTTAGGVTLPAAEMGVVALDELVLHGWDLARATGQPFSVDPGHARVVLGFAVAVSAAPPEAREGLFGPAVDIAPDAPAFDRALGLAGRDPAWEPGHAPAGSAGRAPAGG